MQNESVFLMKDWLLIEAALKETRVKVSDIYAKLREANALGLQDVRAVVLDTTENISVLHGGSTPDDQILAGVL